MQKLRNAYVKYQSEIQATNPRFVNAQKTNKLASMAEGELQVMRVKQDFTHYDQAAFYRDKFSKLSDIAIKCEQKKISDENYHKSAREIVKDNFIPHPSNVPIDQNLSFGRNVDTEIKQRTKSPLKQFFDEHQQKTSKKVNFSSILQKQDTPLKYGLKSVSRSKASSIIRPKNIENDQQLRRLETENRRLKQQLNQEKKNLSVNDEERLRDLRNRVKQLDDENRRLRTEMSKSSKSDLFVEEVYDPYNLKIRENNIVRINNKNLYLSEKMSQFGGVSEDFQKEKRTQRIYFDSQADYMRPQSARRISPTPRNMNSEKDVLNSSQSSIQSQLLNLESSELYDETKNQVCRQKIAFFKKSMIIAKGHDFDIAFKRSDFNQQMDKLRLILYVNNKDARSYNCTIEYDYDRQDFDVIVKKRLQNVDGRSQGRQEIEIYLKNASDLGSLITAKVFVGDKIKKIVVPAMFIEFDNDLKYKFENPGFIERNLAQPLTIKPMSQFSTINMTTNVLELTREYDQKYEVGKLYGKSKGCKGIVKLTWKNGNKVKIETCEQWRTLMGYLFLNAEETINY